MPDPGNRERGLRAALSNPRVSEQAKQRDREILASEYGEVVEPPSAPAPEMASPSSKKASHSSSNLKSSPSSHNKKTRSSSSGDMSSGASAASPDMEGKDRSHVIRGLKAAIANPNVSEEAKERDRQKLKSLGE
ncbi:Conidiation protein 6-domain-containing protein [Cladorrhinum samala]|uniref:Conidiation protein 6-domain-containing protein n=1 Tax=Cladorrhinum samala TaxID=585594 RepID=A0AAV9HBK1_9PEZI|nr:Conidiation protein 6-domain-containing protein [Cladorrhinum samala]